MSYQESFLNYLQYEKRCSFHTVRAYRSDLGQFVQFCNKRTGHFNINEVTYGLLREWVVSLMENNVSARSVNRKISTVKSFFRYLQRQELIDCNPVEGLIKPKIGKKLPVFVSEDALNVLFDAGLFPSTFEGIRDKLILAILYGTGVREAELVTLKNRWVNIDACEIKVLGKRNKERIIPYPHSLNAVITEYIDLRNKLYGEPGEYLFITIKNEPIYEKLVYRVVRKYLAKVTTMEYRGPHIIRHSYATHLLNHGANLNAVKELMGHASLQATQIYTHVGFEQLLRVYKQAHPRG